MGRKTTAALGAANVERGELSLSLDGATYVLRPTFEAVSQFEQVTGKGLLELARSAVAGRLTLAETAQVAVACIAAWGRATDNVSAAGARADRIAELILESDGGLHAAGAVVAGMLSMAVTGGYTAQGEPKPATMTRTTGEAPAAG